MKTINNYIQEKLVFNKHTKAKQYTSVITKTTKQIINWLNLYWINEYRDVNSEYFKNIEDWVIDRGIGIDDLEPAANTETLHILKNNIIVSVYNNDDTLNEYCNDEIDRTHLLEENNNLGFEIRYSDKMICNICDAGTLYVIIKDKFKY